MYTRSLMHTRSLMMGALASAGLLLHCSSSDDTGNGGASAGAFTSGSGGALAAGGGVGGTATGVGIAGAGAANGGSGGMETGGAGIVGGGPAGGAATGAGTAGAGIAGTGGTSVGAGGMGTGGKSAGTGGTGTGGTGTGGTGTGGTGTGGTGTGGTGTGTGTGNAGPQSVTQAGGDVYHRATFKEPGLVLATVKATGIAPNTTFNTNATFPANGNLSNQGSPSVLYLSNGPAAAGCPAGAAGCTATTRAAGSGIFVAIAALKSTPNVFAFDESTGKPVWTASLPNGGDGIRGTPVIDPVSRRLFAVTASPHQVHAVSIDTGAEVTTGGWPVTLTFGAGSNDGSQNQHGASLLLNHIMYIPFGGQYGDGGTYKGVVFAVDVNNPASVGSWSTESSRSGIWGSGGLVSDGQSSVFAVTGDTTSVPRNASDSEEVVRLTGMATLARTAANVFVPTEWAGWDRPAGDLDFGASTPAYVPLPAGSNPPALLVAPAKAGRLFILNGANLSSGMYDANRSAGGALADLVVSGTTGETVYTSPTIYTSASGLHATINVGGGSQNCPGGNVTGEVIVSTLIKPGQTPIASGEAWCAKNNSGGGHTNYPPISTTTDGVSANALVWFIDGGQIRAVDGDTGAAVATSTGAGCMSVPSMSFPIAVNNRIVVAALGHLCSWSVGGT